MHDFLKMALCAPVLLGSLWVYTSRLQSLNGHTATKVAIRIVSFVIFFGGFFTQIAYLRNHEPLDTRRLYMEALVFLVSIPGIVIVFCRRHNGNNGNR